MRVAFALALLPLAVAGLFSACTGVDPVLTPDAGTEPVAPKDLCATDDDCAKTYGAATRPVGCATFQCLPSASGEKRCAAFAIDKDGDGHFVSECELPASVGLPVLLGDDCDDGDPALYAGKTVACNVAGTPKPTTGACRDGVIRCEDGKKTACDGAVGPTPAETCGDGIDNDCNGAVDDTCTCVDGATQLCGIGVGACKKGLQTCKDNAWGACVGKIDPGPRSCTGNVDNNCNGTVDGNEAACRCNGVAVGTTATCGSDVGTCSTGTRTCTEHDGSASWSTCVGEVTPTQDGCRPNYDDDCNGVAGDGPGCIGAAAAPACGNVAISDAKLLTVFRRCVSGNTVNYGVGCLTGATADGPSLGVVCDAAGPPAGWVPMYRTPIGSTGKVYDALGKQGCLPQPNAPLLVNGIPCYGPP